MFPLVLKMAQITIQQAIQPLAINFCQSTRQLSQHSNLWQYQ